MEVRVSEIRIYTQIMMMSAKEATEDAGTLSSDDIDLPIPYSETLLCGEIKRLNDRSDRRWIWLAWIGVILRDPMPEKIPHPIMIQKRSQ